jgi:hypothetical protein
MEEEKLRKIGDIIHKIGIIELDGKIPTMDECYDALVEIYGILHAEDADVGIPYIGFSNETLKDAEKIQEGDSAPCPKCGELVLVRNSDPPTLQFIEHCGSSWLAGVDGKYVGNKPSDCSGKV